MLTQVRMGILTPSLLRDPHQGKAFLELLPACYAPETYNDHEPINRPFTTIDDAISCWYLSFLWRRKKPQLMGHALFAGHNVHPCVYLTLSIKAFDLSASLELMRRMCKTFGVDIAYIHVCSSTDTDDIDDFERYVMPFSEGLTTFDLAEGIPGFPWALLLGKPYLEIFGDRINSVPVHYSEVMKDATYLQLTENFKDVENETYNRAKTTAMRHLNSNVFRTSNLSETYNVPEFSIDRGY